MLWVPSALGIISTVALYPTTRAHALWFLTAIPAGLLMRTMFAYVGKRLRRLHNELPDPSADVHESLMTIGKIQSPGLAILANDQLQLIPLVGKPLTIPLADIQSVKQSPMLPGKYLIGKTAFHITTPDHTRLAFAVDNLTAARWSSIVVSQ